MTTKQVLITGSPGHFQTVTKVFEAGGASLSCDVRHKNLLASGSSAGEERS